MENNNFQNSRKPKRRKLYTPLSPSEEENNNEVNGHEYWPRQNVILQKNQDSSSSSKQQKANNDNEKCVAEKNGNGIPAMKFNSDDEAVNISFRYIKPIFQKNPTYPSSLSSLLHQFNLRFNSVEVASKVTKSLRSSSRNQYDDDDYEEIINVLMKKKAVNNKTSNEKILSQKKRDKEKEEEEDVIIKEKNQLYSIVEILQPLPQCSHSDNTIKSIPKAKKCHPLKEIFTRHEHSTEKGQNQVSNRFNNINHGQFISSQFRKCDDGNSSNENINVIGTNSLKEQQQQQTKKSKLIEPNVVLNEWLDYSTNENKSVMMRPLNNRTKNDRKLRFTSQATTLSLSKSGKKIRKKNLLASCFL